MNKIEKQDETLRLVVIAPDGPQGMELKVGLTDKSEEELKSRIAELTTEGMDKNEATLQAIEELDIPRMDT